MGDDAVSRLQASPRRLARSWGRCAHCGGRRRRRRGRGRRELFGGLPAVGAAGRVRSSSSSRTRWQRGSSGRSSTKRGMRLHGVECDDGALNRPNSREFLEVYKGVVPEYSDWAEELVGGKCVALRVSFTADPSLSVLKLRELCGAHDPEISRPPPQGLAPRSFGRDKVGTPCTAPTCRRRPARGRLLLPNHAVRFGVWAVRESPITGDRWRGLVYNEGTKGVSDSLAVGILGAPTS